MKSKIVRTNSSHPHFISLVEKLDSDLAERNGKLHKFYAQYNGIEKLKNTVIYYHYDNQPVGCGAFKPFDQETVEVKRMYVTPETRGNGIASKILKTLESWAKELGYRKAVLETGTMNPEAMALYRKKGYSSIPNYGQYKGIETSRCFEKRLS